MALVTFNDINKYKDQNDQISTAISNGATTQEACAEVGLTNNNTGLITTQMKELMNSSLFQRTNVGKLGSNGNITHNGQTQCGVYTVATGGRAKIDIDLDGDGQISEDEKGVDAAQAMAASYDSELDLYIEDSIQKFIQENCGGDTSFWWDGRGFMQPEMQKKLYEEYGIKITQVGDDRRTYSFSLVDADGNVVEDANGNKGSILWGDWVIPDGFAQGAELNLSSILDSIGYDCISKADYVFNEELGGEAAFNKMIDAFHTDAANTLGLTSSSAYTGEESKYMQVSDRKVSDMYGATEIISLASGGGTGNKHVDNALNDLINKATDLGIDIKELSKEGDTSEKISEKIKKAIAKVSKTGEKVSNGIPAIDTETLSDAVKEFEKIFEEKSQENPDIDRDELIKDIAKEFDIDFDVLLEEIRL